MVYILRFSPLQNAICFIIVTYSVPVLFIFHIQDVPKLKKKIRRQNCITTQGATKKKKVRRAVGLSKTWSSPLAVVSTKVSKAKVLRTKLRGGVIATSYTPGLPVT